MKFKKCKIEYDFNVGRFQGQVVTDIPIQGEEFKTTVLNFSLDEQARKIILFTPITGNTYEIDSDGIRDSLNDEKTIESCLTDGFILGLIEGEYEAFQAEVSNFYKFVSSEIEKGCIRDKNGSLCVTDTYELQEFFRDKAFDPQQRAFLKFLMSDKDMEKNDFYRIANSKYNYRQMQFVYFGILSGFSGREMDMFSDPKFSAEQMNEIYTALVNGIPDSVVEVFADIRFSAEQMKEIRLGFENGLTVADVGLYARPELPVEKMTIIRSGFMQGLKIDDLENIPMNINSAFMCNWIKEKVREKKFQNFLSEDNEYLGIIRKDSNGGYVIDNLQDVTLETQFKLWETLQPQKNNIISYKERDLNSTLECFKEEEPLKSKQGR